MSSSQINGPDDIDRVVGGAAAKAIDARSLADDLLDDRIRCRVQRLERVIAQLRIRARSYDALRREVPAGLRQATSDFEDELLRLRRGWS